MASRIERPGAYIPSVSSCMPRLPPAPVHHHPEPSQTASSSRPRRRVQVGMYGELTWVEEKPPSNERHRRSAPTTPSPVMSRNNSTPRLPSIIEEAQRPPRSTSLAVGAPSARPHHTQRRALSDHRTHEHRRPPSPSVAVRAGGHTTTTKVQQQQQQHIGQLAPPELAIAWEGKRVPGGATVVVAGGSDHSTDLSSRHLRRDVYSGDSGSERSDISYGRDTPPLDSDSPHTPGTPEELLATPSTSLQGSPHASPNGSLRGAPGWNGHAKGGFI